MRRLKRTLTALALVAVAVGRTLGWSPVSAQTLLTAPLPGVEAWLADTSLGRPLPDPSTAGPAEIAAFFDGTTERQRVRLAEEHPAVVGNLDGAPIGLRYRANKAATGRDGVLAYDPRGRGRIATVIGDLATAAHVSIVVPGSDISASSRFGRLERMAERLQKEAGEDTAVIAWAGYTTPEGLGIDAATGRLAEDGAERLTLLTRGLDAIGAPDPVLFCHSYGSVVCGLAAAGTDATDIVVLGSPGMRAGTAADLRTDATVWAATSPRDWIRHIPHVEFLGLGHGTDPTDPAFGARTLDASRVPLHSAYFDTGTTTLAAFAAIATGGDPR